MTIKINGKEYADAHEFFEDMQREFQGKPWHYKTRIYVRRGWNRWMVPSPYRKTKWFIQRGRRGFADCDVWSLDSYITRVLSQALPVLARGHAYPGYDPWDTPEKWQAHLTDLAMRMGAWNSDTFCDSDAYEVTRAAVEEFGRHLGSYWD